MVKSRIKEICLCKAATTSFQGVWALIFISAKDTKEKYVA